MKDSLSIQEQNEILNKIRDEYRENSKKYSKKVFDTDAFENRLQQAIKMRIDMKNFFLIEITTLEALKDKMESKLKAKESKFMQKIDEMIQNNLNKIAHYKDYNFHPKVTYEIKKILGALNDFLENEFYWFETILKKENEISIINSVKLFRDELNQFVGHAGTKFAPKIEDHLLLLNSKFPDYKKIELNEKRLIKDIALYLNKLKAFLVNLTYENKLHNIKLAINKNDLPEHILPNLIGETPEKIIKNIITKINNILSDFRIHDFKLSK